MGWGEYGRFTINLGVWVDELRRADIVAEDRSTVGVAECHIQAQIGDLLRPSVDTWWEMFESTTAGSEARDSLLRFGLPWLDGLRTRADILEAGDMGTGHSSHLLGLSTLDLARLYFAHDDRHSAAVLIATYLAEDLHPVHRRSVRATLSSWGMSDLLPLADLEGWSRRSTVEFTTDSYSAHGAPPGTPAIVVDGGPDGYLVELITPEGWGPIVGPVAETDLTLIRLFI